MRTELKSYKVVARDSLPSNAKRAYIDPERTIVIDRADCFKFDFYDVPDADHYYAVVSDRAIRAAHKLHFTVDKFGKNCPENATEIVDKLNRIIDSLVLCTSRDVEDLWHVWEMGEVDGVPNPRYKNDRIDLRKWGLPEYISKPARSEANEENH